MIKRSIDIVFSSTALIMLLPFLLIACLAVYAEDRRNPLFSHTRYGKDMSLFTLYKIRTMSVPNPNDNREIEDLQRDWRVTKVGKLLRAFHIDELPQLWNIFKGDMSIVGPRPIPYSMRVKHIANWQYRSTVRPGLTGLAQIHCTKFTTLHSKFHFDALYVKKASLWLDIKLVLATFSMVMPLMTFIGWTAVILLATLLPIPEESIPTMGFVYADKLVHYSLFLVMVLAAVWFGSGFLKGSSRLAFGIIWCLFLAGGTEFAQSFLPLRNMSLLDFVADIAGIGVGSGFCLLVFMEGLECKSAAS